MLEQHVPAFASPVDYENHRHRGASSTPQLGRLRDGCHIDELHTEPLSLHLSATR